MEERKSLWDIRFNKKLGSKNKRKREKAEAYAMNDMLDNW